MELINILAKQFITDVNADGVLDGTDVAAALQNLLSDSSGNLNLSGIVSQLQGLGLADIAASWLGDGENAAISSEQISQIFGNDQLSSFASSLNLEENNVTQALTSALPELIDKMSSGGALSNLLGDQAGELLGSLKKLF